MLGQISTLITTFRAISGADGEDDGHTGAMVLLADSVSEVLLVMLMYQALVVDEEDEGGHGYGCVAIIHHSSGVEELHTFFVFLMLAGWFVHHGFLKEPVELASGDGVLGGLADFADLVKNLGNMLPLFR